MSLESGVLGYLFNLDNWAKDILVNNLNYPTSSSAATSTTARPSLSTPSVKAMKRQNPCTASSARPAAP